MWRLPVVDAQAVAVWLRHCAMSMHECWLRGDCALDNCFMVGEVVSKLFDSPPYAARLAESRASDDWADVAARSCAVGSRLARFAATLALPRTAVFSRGDRALVELAIESIGRVVRGDWATEEGWGQARACVLAASEVMLRRLSRSRRRAVRRVAFVGSDDAAILPGDSFVEVDALVADVDLVRVARSVFV